MTQRQAEPPGKDQGAVKIRVRPVDAETGKSVPGIVRVCRAREDWPLALSGLYDRLRGPNRKNFRGGMAGREPRCG